MIRYSLLFSLLVLGPGISSASSAQRASSPKTLIIAIGDSTTAGTPFFKSPLEAPPDGFGDEEAPYTYWMAKNRPQWTVLNYGINGETSNQIRARFVDAVKMGPRYIVILAGINDVYRGISSKEVAKNLFWMYQQAQGHSMMPVAATLPPFDQMSPTQAQALDELNAWIKNAADKMRIPLADLNAATRDPNSPHQLNGSPDGLHPDQGGYRKMGLRVKEAIDPIEKAWR